MDSIRGYVRRFIFHFFLISVASYIVYNYDLTSLSSISSLFSSNHQIITNRREEGTRNRKLAEVEAAILKQGRRLIAETCSPNTNFCYLITDTAVKEEDELVVKRSMVLKDLPQYAFTIAELEKPQELSWAKHNTRHWPINKLVVVSRYIKVMIAAGFFTEAMSLQPQSQQEVLMIGLGGGVASNFLSMLDWLMIHTTVVELDPYVATVARQYFDHTDELRTNLIIDDGVEYLKRAVENGEKYHSIMLDACYNSDEPQLCPVKEFEQVETIKNLAACLEEGGVLTVNVICTKDSVSHELEILKLYRPHFPSCYLSKFLPERQMLICSNRKNWTWDEQRARFKKNLAAADDIFDFRLSQYFN